MSARPLHPAAPAAPLLLRALLYAAWLLIAVPPRAQTRRMNLMLCALLLSAAVCPMPTAAAGAWTAPPVLPLETAPFGINTHLASRYPDPATMNVPADLVAQAGAGWAREDIHWYRIQPDAQTWDWTFTDAAFRELLQRNIQIVGVLGHPPGWATLDPNDTPYAYSFAAPDPALFASFAQAVVARYGRYVHHWEIWNEPDNPLFWLPKPDPAAYAALLRASAAAIRAANPQSKIILGGVNPFDSTFLRGVAEAGGWPSFDILGIHPYVDPATPEAGGIGAATAGARALMLRYGEKPIWATEVGWSSGPGDRDQRGVTSASQQADYLLRATLLLWRAGVERVFWYALKDDAHNPYGLFAFGTGRADFTTPKPAYQTFRAASRLLGGARFSGMTDLFSRTLVERFDAGGWRRGAEPYGAVDIVAAPSREGTALRLRYSFPWPAGGFLVALRDRPAPLSGRPYAVGAWVYGDGSGRSVKLWLRDARGRTFQYPLGKIGGSGWQFLSTPIGGTVAPWNRISASDDGDPVYPLAVAGLTVDNAPDGLAGTGTIYLADITALSGPEAYDLQLTRGGRSLDVLWAPAATQARLPIGAAAADVTIGSGLPQRQAAKDGQLLLTLGPTPLFVQR